MIDKHVAYHQNIILKKYEILLVIILNCRLAQPVFLGMMVEYYTPGQTSVTQEEAYWYAGAVVMCSAINVFIVHPYMMAILHMGMKFRVACCSLIYRKVKRFKLNTHKKLINIAYM